VLSGDRRGPPARTRSALDASIAAIVPLADGRLLAAARGDERALGLVWLDRKGREQKRARVGTGVDTIAVRLATVPGGGVVLGGTLMGGRLDDQHAHVARNGMDVFVMRLDDDGRTQWTRVLGGGHRRWSPDDDLRDLAVGSDGSVWAIGGCRAERLRTLPNARGLSIECGDLDTSDVFFARWSKDGELVHLQQLSGKMVRTRPDKTWHSNHGTIPGRIVATADGGAVWTIGFDEDARFGRGSTRAQVRTRGSFDVVVGRFGNDGELVWWQHIGGAARDDAGGLAIDRDDRTWVLAVDASGGPDGLVLAYGRDGSLAHRSAMRVEPTAIGPELRPAGLALADAGVRALVWFAGAVRFPDGEATLTLRGRGEKGIPDDLALWALPLPR
jgi:hypothetical protein